MVLNDKRAEALLKNNFGPFYIAYGNAAKSYFQSIAEDVKKGEPPQKNDFGSRFSAIACRLF